jgi:hypothetical protein
MHKYVSANVNLFRMPNTTVTPQLLVLVYIGILLPISIEKVMGS